LQKIVCKMLDIQTRKIQFVQKFLSIKREDTITKFEKLLLKETGGHHNDTIQPMTLEELNARIDRSEEDFREGRFKEGKELLKKFE
jgi:hypothetical protein